MSHTEKRIEMIKLLQRLKRDDELPGDTILRALYALALFDGTAHWLSQTKQVTDREHVMLGALQAIIAQTEPDAIPHRDYAHLARDICDCAKAAIADFSDTERTEAMLGIHHNK